MGSQINYSHAGPQDVFTKGNYQLCLSLMKLSSHLNSFPHEPLIYSVSDAAVLFVGMIICISSKYIYKYKYIYILK